MCRRKEGRPAVTPPRPPPLWLLDPGAAGGLRALPWKGHQRILSCLRTLFPFYETTRAAGWTFCAFYESVCVRPPAAYRLLYLVVIAEMLGSFDLISCFRSDFKRVCSPAAGKIGSLCFWLHSTMCSTCFYIFHISATNALILRFIYSGSKHSDRDKTVERLCL